METAHNPARLGMAGGGKIKCMAEGGLISSLISKLTPKTPAQRYAEHEAAQAPAKPVTKAPAPPAAAPGAPGGALNPANALKAREAAAGLAKGGKVPGKSPSDTADNIPIMATAGEFMVKKAAVDKLGVDFMEKINSVADGDQKPKLGQVKRKRRGKRKGYSQGGLLMFDEYRNPRPAGGEPGAPATPKPTPNIAPAAVTPPAPGPAFQSPVPRASQMLANQSNPTNAAMAANGRNPAFPQGLGHRGTAMVVAPPAPAPNFTIPQGTPQRPALPAPAPGTALATTPARPNFTMPQQFAQPPAAPLALPAPPLPPVDVQRQAWQGRTGSPQAEAWQASRTQTAAPAAAPTAAAAPAAGPSRLGVIRGAVNRIGKSVAPLALGATAAQVATTDTEDYAKRFGMENTQPGVLRDVGIRTLGAASDLGNTLALGIPRALGAFRDDAAAPPPVAGQLAPNQTITSPRSAAAPAPMPVAAAQEMAAPALGQVTRVGNSYSGPAGISGNITVNGKTPGGGFVGNTGTGAPVRLGPNPSFDQALSDARDQAQARGDFDAVRRSYGGDFGTTKVDPVDALINNGKPMTARKAAAIAQMQAARAQAENAASGRNLDAQRFAMDKEGADLTNREKKSILSAQDAYNNAKNPAEKAAAEERLRAVTKQWEKAPAPLPDPFASGQIGTDKNGNPIHGIYDKRTGKVQEQKAVKVSSQAEFDALPAGSTYTGPDGKTYRK